MTFTGKGHARCYCRVGIEQHRKEVDGSFTKPDRHRHQPRHRRSLRALVIDPDKKHQPRGLPPGPKKGAPRQGDMKKGYRYPQK